MKFALALAIIAMATAYTSGASTAKPQMGDPFIKLIKDIETSDFFPGLTLERRLLTFEMLSAAETKHLKVLYDRIGYVTILEYLDDLPEDYQHNFITYSVDHLKIEKEYYGYEV